jgi:LacI family transcriptional regulator
LKDVAARAGVSITTVSVVLNKRRDGVRVPEATRERVRAAADELGYRPNEMARGLRQRSSQAIGFISDELTITPFAVAMLAAAQEEAAHAGQMLLTLSLGAAPSEHDVESAVDSMLQHQISSLVIALMYHQEINPVSELPPTTVFVNCRATSGQFRSIVPSEEAAGHAATRELIEHGHTRIAFIDDVADTVASRLRHRGYLRAHTEAGITPDPRLHIEVTPAALGGVTSGSVLDLPGELRPTGAFCYNDRIAMGFYRAARQRGLSVPEDLSVVGFDDQEYIASELDPPLTTMRLPHAEMGSLAIRTLLGQDVSDADWQASGDGQVALVDCPIVRRESVASPPPH